MAYVNPATQSIKTCFQGRYSLPYFQREYKWQPRHYAELVTDIQESFLLSFEKNHGRTEVASYQPYFLGSIITSSEVGGKKPLIDGQQRLTSTFLMLAYLERLRRDVKVKDAVDLSNLLGSVSYGVMDYSIEFSNTRKSVFDAYLNQDLAMTAALEAAEDVKNLDDGDRRLLEALRDTDTLLDDVVKAHIAHFIDYVVERVLLIDISVASEAEAHRVFVTMNDRGLRLGPIDLLKGQILSNIPSSQLSQQAHASWVASTATLRGLGAEEDSLFFRTLFRAKWANSIRGKSKGDAPGDFDVIGDEYHRWFSDNLHKLGIKNSGDYFRFVTIDISKYVEVYAFINEVESKLTPGYEAFFFNSSRKFSSASLISLAIGDAGDTSAQWKEKIALLARFVDLLLSTRSMELKQNNYENLRHIVFALAKALRGKSYAELLDYVRAEWPKHSMLLPKMADLTYSSSEKDILFLLARIAYHLEEGLGVKTRTGFATFLKRDRNLRTFDIEHILKKSFDTSTLCAGHGFTDVKEYAQQRDTLGGLILLPRSRNRSLSDHSYSKKLAAYATENILAQTLTGNFYVNNPGVKEFAKSCPSIALSPVAGFGKAEIAARAKLYVETARVIWADP